MSFTYPRGQNSTVDYALYHNIYWNTFFQVSQFKFWAKVNKKFHKSSKKSVKFNFSSLRYDTHNTNYYYTMKVESLAHYLKKEFLKFTTLLFWDSTPQVRQNFIWFGGNFKLTNHMAADMRPELKINMTRRKNVTNSLTFKNLPFVE